MAKQIERAPGTDGQRERPLRMRDLVRASGLTRETIHFYLTQGLLPPPVASGRNTALYGPEHLERLRKIRELQEQQFLPLRAIKAVFDERAGKGFTPRQDEVIRRVRVTLRGWVDRAPRGAVPLANFVPDQVSRGELRTLVAAGLIAVSGAGPRATVSEEDAEILACWSEFKEIGFGPAQGITPKEMLLYDRAMERLVREEVKTFSRRLAQASGEAAVDLIARSVPVTNRLLGALRRRQLRRFVTAPDERASD